MTLQHHVKLKLLILICQSLISYSIKTAPFCNLFKKGQYACIHDMNIHNTDNIDSSYFPYQIAQRFKESDISNGSGTAYTSGTNELTPVFSEVRFVQS